jgi:hypothetical protein
VHADLPSDCELDARGLSILALAARQVDDVAALERALRRDGETVPGSQGQPRLNPMIAEIRQGRFTVARLLGELDLSDADAEPRSARSRRVQAAVNARWDAREQRAEQRRRRSA